MHLVKFDTIVSDGSANDDHLFANVHQQHGRFGALIIEEAGMIFQTRSSKDAPKNQARQGLGILMLISSVSSLCKNEAGLN